MDGIGGLISYALLGCLAAAFLLELALNRRPLVVALVVPFVVFFALTVWLSWAIGEGLVFEFDALFFGIYMVAGVPASLIGSGLARGLRIAVEIYKLRMNSKS